MSSPPTEHNWLIHHRLPFVRLQTRELGEEIIKLLRSSTEDLDIDQRPPPTSAQPHWLPSPATTAAPPPPPHVNLWLSIEGCLVRKAQIDMHFSPKKHFSTALTPDTDTPWVLEQLLLARKEMERALEALSQTSDDDATSLCDLFDIVLSCLTHARNAFIVPPLLNFPRTMRPFNGFAPALAREYLLEFSVMRNLLVVSCFRVEYLPSASSKVSTLLPDSWFFDPTRLVGLQVEFEGRIVSILEQHTCTCQVALFDKALALINEARTTVQDFRENLIALLQPPALSLDLVQPASAKEISEYLYDA